MRRLTASRSLANSASAWTSSGLFGVGGASFGGEHLEFRLAHYRDDPTVAARYAPLRRSLGLPELGAVGSNGGSKPLTLVQAVA